MRVSLVTQLLTIVVLCGAGSALGDYRSEAMPEGIVGVGVDEHLSAKLPLDATFIDESGNSVRLGDYFTGKRPVILQLGYYQCPMLCNRISQGMADSMKQLDLEMGKDFEVVTLSFDPKETPKLAAAKKKTYATAVGKGGVDEGWHFLVGDAPNIERVTQAAGFRYKWLEDRREYSHPAVLIIATPDGRISQYLYGVKFAQKTMRLSLVEASEGKIGTVADRIMLFCFHYDSETGKYTLAAMNLMRLGGVLTVAILALVIWRWVRRDKHTADPAPAGA